MKENIFIKDASGHKLSAILSKVSDTKIVILCHGRGASKNNMTSINLEKIFNKNGISTLRFDFEGHGESYGQLEDITLSIGIDNLLTVYNYLIEQGYTDFGLVGVSFGGSVSFLTEPRMKKVKVMALKVPVFDYKEKEDLEWGKEGIKKWQSDGFIFQGKDKFNYLFYKDAASIDYRKSASKVKVPTLIIASEDDEKVPLKQPKELNNLIKNSKLIVFKGSGHTFPDPKLHDEANVYISEFIIKSL